VLIDLEGAIKIADFGLSAQLTRETTKLNEETGTPHWTAPEIILGDEYDAKIDVWSFGIFVFELA
jgi:serine/threonine protein kinase